MSHDEYGSRKVKTKSGLVSGSLLFFGGVRNGYPSDWTTVVAAVRSAYMALTV